MTAKETLLMPYGEMISLINCRSIDLGHVDAKMEKQWTFDEAMKLR